MTQTTVRLVNWNKQRKCCCQIRPRVLTVSIWIFFGMFFIITHCGCWICIISAWGSLLSRRVGNEASRFTFQKRKIFRIRQALTTRFVSYLRLWSCLTNCVQLFCEPFGKQWQIPIFFRRKLCSVDTLEKVLEYQAEPKGNEEVHLSRRFRHQKSY